MECRDSPKIEKLGVRDMIWGVWEQKQEEEPAMMSHDLEQGQPDTVIPAQ